jgi:hypothetical protein
MAMIRTGGAPLTRAEVSSSSRRGTLRPRAHHVARRLVPFAVVLSGCWRSPRSNSPVSLVGNASGCFPSTGREGARARRSAPAVRRCHDRAALTRGCSGSCRRYARQDRASAGRADAHGVHLAAHARTGHRGDRSAAPTQRLPRFERRLDRRTVQDALARDVPAKRISARCQFARRAGAEDQRSPSAWTRHRRAGAVLGRSEIPPGMTLSQWRSGPGARPPAQAVAAAPAAHSERELRPADVARR